ncbi:MAG: MgtC/SapB family protein [Caldilineaceae bacterium]|nr:MgtC/SapB family protein [Caldilineaceae bacterium]
MDLTPLTVQFELQLLLRICLSLLTGGLVGYEREQADKPAGVRTHGILSLGAALFTIVSLYGFGSTSDSARVAAQIVSGVGFLGAGVILHRRGSVRGLTSAAGLWVTAAIGMAVGAGMFLTAIVSALLVFFFLRFGPHTRRPGSEYEEE